MNRVARVLAPATKGVAWASLILAIGCGSWLARPVWHLLPVAAAVAALAGLAGGRVAPVLTSATILSFTYVAPAVVLATRGRFSVEFLLVWSAALTGLLLADPGRWSWSYPRRWRVPLVLWALTVAVAWPLTALREIDFESYSLVTRYRVSSTGIGGSPRMVILWGIDTATAHLLGLLWFDWLLRRCAGPAGRAIEGEVLWPLVASATAGSLLALYQGLVDLSFLSVGAWSVLQRAAGPLLDANASGMVFALWTGGLLALAARSLARRAVACAGALTCWGGLWMTGSRTALATASIALVSAGVAALLHARRSARRLAMVTTATVLTAAAGTLLLMTLLSGASESPLRRLRATLPADFSRAAVVEFVAEMWNRNGYGLAATALIAERPLTGVGIGLFNLAGGAFLHARDPGIPPDNAQNWWRHHVAELGFAGSAGLLLWTAVFVTFLLRTRGSGDQRVPAAAVKGALVGFGLTSLVGMPAQSLAVAMTFWGFAFWYARLVGPTSEPGTPHRLAGWTWVVLVAFPVAYLVGLGVLARGRDRPAVRAAAGGWPYAYGMSDPGADAGGEMRRLIERHGVAVIANDGPWMLLTVRAEHPDLETHPVRVRVTVNGKAVYDSTLHTNAPLTRMVHTGSHPRAVVEARLDRTRRSDGAASDPPETGLVLEWRFSREQPRGFPTIMAPFTY